MHGTYRFIIGLGNDERGYILPEYDFVLGDPPWTSEAPAITTRRPTRSGPTSRRSSMTTPTS